MEEDYVIALQQADITNRNEALTYLAQLLYEKGDVKASFSAAVMEREEHFATGLAMDGYGVAIPHTDKEHVNQSKIAVMTLKEPVEFFQMGSSTDQVEVSVIIMLALKDSHGHLDMLSQLMALFQKKDVMAELLALEDTAEGHKRLVDLLQENGIHL